MLNMRAAITLATLLGTSLALVASVSGQALLPKATVQHATVVAAASVASVAPGGVVTLFADVIPNPSIHIYAAGAKDFTPVSLVTTPNAAVSTGKPRYPRADVASAPGSTDAAPAYNKLFRIALPATIKATTKSGEVITVGGAVTYQACDERLCYPVSIAPVTWQVVVK